MKNQQAHFEGIHKRVMPQARARLCSGTMPLDEGSSCLTGVRPRQAATFEQLGARVFLHVLCIQLPGKLRQVASQRGSAMTWVGMQGPRSCS